MHRYKYISEPFANNLLNGELLFRSLSYFINYERTDPRSDPMDGTKMYRPKEGLVINTVQPARGSFIYYGGSMVASIKRPDEIFVMCLSNSLSNNLALKFNVKGCVEILSAHRFEQLATNAIKTSFPGAVCLGRNVKYYALSEEMGIDWSSPEHVLFRKRSEYYSSEREFRLAFGTKDALAFEPSAANMELKFYHPNHPEPESPAPMLGPFSQHIIKIGDIRKICRVHAF